MTIVVVVLMIIIGLSLLYHIRFQLELKHFHDQLDELEKGSQMELNSGIASRSFLNLYKRLDQVFSLRAKELHQYRQRQEQVKHSIAGMAHDIRTPLTSAAGYLQMLQGLDGDEQQQRYQDIINSRLAQLKDMLEELFLYTRLSDEEYEIPCDRLEVFPVLSECLIGMYHVFEEQGITPEIDFQDEMLCINGNLESIGRIFRNLIGNALLHGGGGIRIVQRGGSISFMNPLPKGLEVDVECLFERFYKGDITRKKGSSGLGLSIVKELVQRMDGDVKAEIVDGWLKITVLLMVI